MYDMRRKENRNTSNTQKMIRKAINSKVRSSKPSPKKTVEPAQKKQIDITETETFKKVDKASEDFSVGFFKIVGYFLLGTPLMFLVGGIIGANGSGSLNGVNTGVLAVVGVLAFIISGMITAAVFKAIFKRNPKPEVSPKERKVFSFKRLVIGLLLSTFVAWPIAAGIIVSFSVDPESNYILLQGGLLLLVTIAAVWVPIAKSYKKAEDSQG